MGITDVPRPVAARLDASDREAIAVIAATLTMPHRREASITDAVKAALSMAAETVKARNANPTASHRS